MKNTIIKCRLMDKDNANLLTDATINLSIMPPKNENDNPETAA